VGFDELHQGQAMHAERQQIVIRDGKAVISMPPPNPKPTATQHDPGCSGAFGLPTHIRFSGQMKVLRMEPVCAGQTDTRPAFSRVGSVGPARWPHLGPMK
jgi:hypothetical protein